MAGHSKWKNIQHRKGAQDAKRGKMFTKLIKEITVASKVGGPDAESNPRLRAAISNAKSFNMPKDKIEKAIQKAQGGNDDTAEVNYEGFGPSGVAIFVECATDNNTRTVSNVRSYFNKWGGSLGKEGCLQYVFAQKGVFLVKAKDGTDVEELTLELIDFGAEECEQEGEHISIHTSMEDFGKMQKELDAQGFEIVEAGLQRIPQDMKEVTLEDFLKIQKLIDRLEDDDDVQRVFHNLEMTEEIEKHLAED